MVVKDILERYAGPVVITLLLVMGVALMLSLNVGGIVFGLGCWVVAYALWLLGRAVTAVEAVMDVQAQTLRREQQRAVGSREDMRSTPASAGN